MFMLIAAGSIGAGFAAHYFKRRNQLLYGAVEVWFGIRLLLFLRAR